MYSNFSSFKDMNDIGFVKERKGQKNFEDSDIHCLICHKRPLYLVGTTR